MSKVKITWVFCGYLPFGRDEYLKMLEAEGYEIKPDVSFEFEFDFGNDFDDFMACEYVFSNTNRYEGKLWDAIEAQLPSNRSHTALSVGDKVEIDGREYVCSEIGFKALQVA